MLERIVNGHLARLVDEHLPWTYAKVQPLKDAA